MNRLAHVLAREAPALAVPFTSDVSDEVIAEHVGYIDVAEFRADYFQGANPTYISWVAGRIADYLPLLVTIRRGEEAGGNGGWDGPEQTRLGLFRTLLRAAEGLDIELEAVIMPDVIGMARQVGKVAIVSSHDFTQTPSLDELEDRLGRSQVAGGDYFKLAAMVNTASEYDTLSEFTLNHKNDNVIVVGIGEKFGPQSRIELPGAGSRLTYAAGGTGSTASGQMGYIETHQALCNAYPSYAAAWNYGE